LPLPLRLFPQWRICGGGALRPLRRGSERNQNGRPQKWTSDLRSHRRRFQHKPGSGRLFWIPAFSRFQAGQGQAWGHSLATADLCHGVGLVIIPFNAAGLAPANSLECLHDAPALGTP
jgi:hypothetical protein